MILELHMLQNFAPSCLNRDDTNSPKECQFGGYRRARISSQCIKRAIRDCFKNERLLDAEVLAIRTKRLIAALSEQIASKGKPRDQAQNIVTKAIKNAGLGVNGIETEYLFFVGKKELANIAEVILTHWDELAAIETDVDKGKKKEVKGSISTELARELKKALDGGKAADLALFGRMLADLPGKNIDAACQVAHAISTNRVNIEFDFYTAMDDLKQIDDKPGAGMMGTVEFNSACYYRYANIDLEQLKTNLDGDKELACKTVNAFLKASVMAIPTGKQNSMSAQNPPSFIFAVVRGTGAWSLANAFARPISAGNNGDLVQLSISALVDYWNKLVKAYSDKDIKAKPALALDEVELKGLTRVESFDKLVEEVSKALICN
jgi:CRISPR system Cascade subunit CasC